MVRTLLARDGGNRELLHHSRKLVSLLTVISLQVVRSGRQAPQVSVIFVGKKYTQLTRQPLKKKRGEQLAAMLVPGAKLQHVRQQLCWPPVAEWVHGENFLHTLEVAEDVGGQESLLETLVWLRRVRLGYQMDDGLDRVLVQGRCDEAELVRLSGYSPKTELGLDRSKPRRRSIGPESRQLEI